jgi:Arc/MetJ-type ribon-helix-helix transcriptional regulator
MEFPVRITLPLSAEMSARIDSLVDKGRKEVRLDLIREAIERELERRERASKTTK